MSARSTLRPASAEARPDQPIEGILAQVRQPARSLLADYRIPEDDAQDLLQEALTALIFKWEAIRNPVAWFLATLKNRCQIYQRRQLERQLVYEAAQQAPGPSALEMPTPQRITELRHDLNSAISRLPPEYRQLLHLRYGLGCTGAEMAEQLGCGCDGVRRDLTACLTLLARELEAGGFA